MGILLFLLPCVIKSASVEWSISPYVGAFHPTDTILQRYFDRSNVFMYGIGFDITASKYLIGAHLKIQRFSFNVHDIRRDEHVDGIWCTIGLEKIIPLSFVSFYGRLGGTSHYDSYDRFSLDNFRFGFQTGLGVRLNVTRHIKPFLELDYEYERLSIPYYVNIAYSRHQAYLAGKDFKAGGFLIQAGISFSL